MSQSNLLTAAQRVKYRFAGEIFDRVIATQTFFAVGIKRLIDSYGDAYLTFVNDHVAFIFHRRPQHQEELERSVKAYTNYSMEYLYLQFQLESSEEARYQCASFEEGRRAVYDNPAVMEGYYLDGLYLSLVLWPNHYRMLRYFLDQFMAWLPQKGHFLELPVGSGSYAAYGLIGKADWTGLGVDISASALVYASQLMQHWGLADRLRIEFGEGQKTLPWEAGSFDAVITGELLEHLDDPASFLAECVRVTKPGGFLFVTTAIYAASVDHVFMFEDVESVNHMLQGSGATLWSYLAIPVRPEDPLGRRIPTNYAAILQKPA
jgi:SAM-dependent methyltransferase